MQKSVLLTLAIALQLACNTGSKPDDKDSGFERYLLTLGGYCDDAVYMARIRRDGTLEPWKTERSYPLVFGAQGLSCSGANIVVTGGFVCATGKPTAETYSSRVENGALTPWAKQPSLPKPVFTNSLIADGSTLYSMGGWPPYADAVFKARLHDDGSVGPWSTVKSLPAARDFAGVAIAGGHAWLVGGDTGTLQPRTEVYVTTVRDGALGEWKTTTSLPSPGRFGHGLVVHADRLLVIGGGDTKGPTSNVYVADIASDGSVGVWTATTSLPEARWFVGVATTEDTLYVVSGGSSKGATKTVWSAPFTDEGLGKFSPLASLPGGLQDNRAAIVTVRR